MKIKTLRQKARAALTNIRQRCNNPKCAGYKKYGAKGIKVHQSWNNIEQFIKDVGMPPSMDHTIDRIDPYGNYEPGNCRWVKMRVQQNNRTNNHLITFNGETKTLMQWSRDSGIARKTIIGRIKRGWPLDRVFSEKPFFGKNQYSGKNLITFNGKYMTIIEWAKELNIKYCTLRDRLNRLGWPIEKAFTTPVKKR